MRPVIGPDISFYQDEPSTPQGVDFVKMRTISDFVIVRAGQNLWVDSRFAYHYSEAKKVGLPRGSYWFYDSRADPKKQAELWVTTLGNDLGELPLWADFEERYGGSYKGWQNWYVFLERLKALVGKKEIGIYTAYYYWRDNAPKASTQAASLEYFHKYPLWIAHYNAQKPLVPKPWSETEWLLWQYTEKGDGKLYGVESKQIDLNYFNGDEVAFKTRFGLSEPPAPLQFRVDLSLREGPALTFNALGVLKQDDVVSRLAVSQDGNWTQLLREQDDLTGWVNNNYLVAMPVPDPDPTPDPDPIPDPDPTPDPTPDPDPQPPVGTGRMYRVTVASLRVRSGPGVMYEIIGGLSQNQIVEELDVNQDNSWFQIRAQDGLVGWCAGEYLVPVDDVVPTPPPATSQYPWYRVTVSSLLVREGPGTNFRAIGNLVRDDVVAAVGDPTNSGWVQIVRFDGLSGWSSMQYLTSLGQAQPKSIRQRLFKGTTYFRREYVTPRLMVAHVLTLDLKAARFIFSVTPESQPGGISCTRTVSRYLAEFNQQIAINGDGFTYLPQGTAACASGDPVRVNGFAASAGKIYNNKPAATVFININNEITLEKPKGSIYNAVSGDRIILRNGKRIPDLAIDVPAPRTALGLTKNGRGLILMCIDGRQPGYSEGINLHELVDMLIAFGAYNGINMDGGGSSTMVINGTNGLPRILNRPIDNNVPGKERQVANHLGIVIK